MSFGQYKIQGTTSQNVGYKSYVASLSQSGTSAPTATVMYNDIGTITPTYVAPGQYSFTSSGLFTSQKTFSVINQTDEASTFTTVYFSTNRIDVRSYETLTETSANDLLSGTSIEIRVYP